MPNPPSGAVGGRRGGCRRAGPPSPAAPTRPGPSDISRSRLQLLISLKRSLLIEKVIFQRGVPGGRPGPVETDHSRGRSGGRRRMARRRGRSPPADSRGYSSPSCSTKHLQSHFAVLHIQFGWPKTSSPARVSLFYRSPDSFRLLFIDVTIQENGRETTAPN